MPEDTENEGAGESAPELTERETAFMHLMLVQFDIEGVNQFAEMTGDDSALIEGAARYWQAFTRGWGRERHARVYLLQRIDGVELERIAVRTFAAKARERLAGSKRVTPFDGLFELFSVPAFRESFKAAVHQEEFSDAQVIRAMYSNAYPLEARRLTDEALDRAVVEWKRKGGGRKTKHEPHKWEYFALLFDEIGLGPVRPDTVSSDWREWRSLVKSRRATIQEAAASKGED